MLVHYSVHIIIYQSNISIIRLMFQLEKDLFVLIVLEMVWMDILKFKPLLKILIKKKCCLLKMLYNNYLNRLKHLKTKLIN